jgi:FtsP/CotA-like multicopper oxidase with cupredoxin domain
MSSKPHTAFVVALGIAAALLGVSAFSAPAAAADVSITLYGSRTGGWGYSNTSLSIPGPPLTVHVGDNVTLILTATDNRNHNWFIDYNNNSAVNPGEPSSPNFGNAGLPGGSWNFTVSNTTGTFVYRSKGGSDPVTMWGNITILPAGTTPPPLLGGENTVLIVAGVIVIIVAVIAFAAVFWRRMGKPGTPPPPPPEQ